MMKGYDPMPPEPGTPSPERWHGDDSEGYETQPNEPLPLSVRVFGAGIAFSVWCSGAAAVVIPVLYHAAWAPIAAAVVSTLVLLFGLISTIIVAGALDEGDGR